MPMAAKAPRIIIHTGRLEGTLKANSTPVIRADPSQILVCFFNKYFCIKNSKIKQAITEVKVRTNAFHPKNNTEQMKAGISAINTPYIFFSMESPL